MTYIDNPAQVRRWGEIDPGHMWRAHTFDRLAWLYGHARAQRIMAGGDPASVADVAAWNNLGKRSAA